MSLSSETMTPADIAAVTGNHGYGGFGGDGAWWIIILFLFAFAGGWGNGGYGGSSGAANNYVLASDFATIQRQLSDGFSGVEKGVDTIRNGLCDGFYTNAQLINGVNTNILQSANGLQAQIAQCCCDNKMGLADINYNIGSQSACIQNAMCGNTRDIIDNQNANSRAILDALQAQVIEAKNEKIADLQTKVANLNLAASQAAQNNYLIGQLRPSPIPAYQVANPYAYQACGCGCNC